MLGWKPKTDDRDVASARYRCFNPLTELQRRGFPVERFNEREGAKYSAVIFSKLYDDHNYALTSSLKRSGVKIIFDLCDNHFYNPYGLERLKTARRQLRRMIDSADLVVVSTEALSEVVLEEASPVRRPVVIPDAVEEGGIRYVPPRGRLGQWWENHRLAGLEKRPKATLLWFGIHGGPNAPFGLLDLEKQMPLFVEVNRSHPLRLVVVSNSRSKYRRLARGSEIETHYFEWKKVSLPAVMKHADVSVIPITINPFTLCKSNNRLASALYAGVPAVADEIPSYRDLGAYCFLNQWEKGIKSYLEDRELRRRHVEAARVFIDEHYGIRVIADRWERELSAYA